MSQPHEIQVSRDPAGPRGTVTPNIAAVLLRFVVPELSASDAEQHMHSVGKEQFRGAAGTVLQAHGTMQQRQEAHTQAAGRAHALQQYRQGHTAPFRQGQQGSTQQGSTQQASLDQNAVCAAIYAVCGKENVTAQEIRQRVQDIVNLSAAFKLGDVYSDGSLAFLEFKELCEQFSFGEEAETEIESDASCLKEAFELINTSGNGDVHYLEWFQAMLEAPNHVGDRWQGISGGWMTRAVHHAVTHLRESPVMPHAEFLCETSSPVAD